MRNAIPDSAPARPDPKPYIPPAPRPPRAAFRTPGEGSTEPPPTPSDGERGPRYYRDWLERARQAGRGTAGEHRILRIVALPDFEALEHAAADEDRQHWSADRVAAAAAAEAARQKLADAEAAAERAAAEDQRRDEAQRRLTGLRKRLAQIREEIEDAKAGAADASAQLTESIAGRAGDQQEIVRRSTLLAMLVEQRLLAGEVLPDAVRRVETEVRSLEVELGGSAG